MTDRPIIFSAPMVRALLDGRKTQTRRVLKSTTIGDLDRVFQLDDGSWHQSASGGTHMSPLPVRYRAGDRLWVRESGIELPGRAGGSDLFRHDVPATPERGLYWVRERRGPGAAYIVAGCSRENARGHPGSKVRPSIHMPRWASRLTLTVTDVRVQRLQDISEEDCLAEGAPPNEADRPLVYDEGRGGVAMGTPRTWFEGIWDGLNDKKAGAAWRDNPWVAALTFSVEHANIDASTRRTEHV